MMMMKTPVGNLVRARNLRPGDLFMNSLLTLEPLDRNSLRCLIGIVPLSKKEMLCRITFISKGRIFNMTISKGAIYLKIK